MEIHESKKETIIFLQGIVGNKEAFKNEVNQLSSEYSCISFDSLGCREEDLGKNVPYSLEVLVEQLYQTYLINDIESAHLCALSYGGFVASEFAVKYPHLVESLTLSGGYCNAESTFRTTLNKLLLKKKPLLTEEKWLREYVSLMNPNKPTINDDSEGIFYHHALKLHPAVLEKALYVQKEVSSDITLPLVTQPVLWVMGEHDDLHKSTLEHLHEWIPHVEYHELPHAGHVAHIHQPELFMELFRPFLQKRRTYERSG